MCLLLSEYTYSYNMSAMEIFYMPLYLTYLQSGEWCWPLIIQFEGQEWWSYTSTPP
jgi:hypothetical protein